MQSQMHLAFTTWTSDHTSNVLASSVGCLGDGMAMFARLPRLNAKDYADIIEVSGFEHLENALRQGRGAITFTAHMGCWELMAVHVTRLYPNVSMLVRPLDNPRLNDMVRKVRQSGGGSVIDSHDVFRAGVKRLRENGILGILVDQNFYKGGIFVDFFGRPAATNPLVPILARRTGCTVLPMYNVWRNGKVHITCEAPLELSSHPDQSLAIAEDTQRMTKIVERWVQENPTQWLWLHNRWKRRPMPGEFCFTPRSGKEKSEGYLLATRA